MRADNRTEAKFRVEEDALGNVEVPAAHRCMLHRRGQATADQVGSDLRARGRLYPSQSNILETGVTTATRIARRLPCIAVSPLSVNIPRSPCF